MMIYPHNIQLWIHSFLIRYGHHLIEPALFLLTAIGKNSLHFHIPKRVHVKQRLKHGVAQLHLLVTTFTTTGIFCWMAFL